MKQVFRSQKMAISRENEQNEPNSGPGRGAQERLLDTAEQLFCEHGFEGTSVRQLAAAANCNIASVNYYFGGKDKLYIEVWRRLLLKMRDERITSIREVMSQSGGSPPLEELLRAFANAFVGPLADESKARRLTKLMAREMLDQHLPANLFVKEMIVPTMTAIQEALLKVCPGLEESKVPLVIFSIVGQLMHTFGAKTMFEQTDDAELPTLDLTEAVNHIVKFSAAGIRAYIEGKTDEKYA